MSLSITETRFGAVIELPRNLGKQDKANLNTLLDLYRANNISIKQQGSHILTGHDVGLTGVQRNIRPLQLKPGFVPGDVFQMSQT